MCFRTMLAIPPPTPYHHQRNGGTYGDNRSASPSGGPSARGRGWPGCSGRRSAVVRPSTADRGDRSRARHSAGGACHGRRTTGRNGTCRSSPAVASEARHTSCEARHSIGPRKHGIPPCHLCRAASDEGRSGRVARLVWGLGCVHRAGRPTVPARTRGDRRCSRRIRGRDAGQRPPVEHTRTSWWWRTCSKVRGQPPKR